jgi:tetratricopeptide (TPR) repeat protein
MVSRLLETIDAKIRSMSDPVAVDCLKGRKASYYARQGNVEAAEKIVVELRGRYGLRPNAEISAWINLVEGLVEFFRDMNASALDKFRRAHALAVAGGHQSLEALSGAWIAHFEFGRHDVARMRAHLERSLACVSHDDHDALARASLVCGVALHLAGRFDLAKSWYREARLHANAEGDDATISALMFNMSSMAIMNLRQSILGRTDHGKSVDALAEIDSASAYDEMIGAVSLDSTVPILQAHVMSLRERFSDAMRLYTEHSDQARQQGMGKLMSYIEADMAWCLLRLGQTSAARATALSAKSNLETTAAIDIDDYAAAHSRLAQVFLELGLPEEAESHAKSADDAWHRFSALQNEIFLAISSLQRPPPVASDS